MNTGASGSVQVEPLDSQVGLELRLVNADPAERPASLTAFVMGDQPLRIGRANDNDWVFPQGFVSRYQLLIWRVHGLYFVQNQSERCEIAVRSPDRIVGCGDCETLNPGDSFWIKSLEVGSALWMDPEDAFKGTQEDADQGKGIAEAPEEVKAAGQQSVEPISILMSILGGAKPAEETPAFCEAQTPEIQLRPRWWEEPGAGSELPAEVNADQQTAATLLRALCEGAGVKPEELELTPELAQELGSVLRTTIAGVVRLVQARRTVRQELRLEKTRINAIANNPLKVSAEEGRVLRSLFAGNGKGFIPPAEAFEQTFGELIDHQIALIAAMRSAFEHLLKGISPETLDASARGQAGGVLATLGLGRHSHRARYARQHADWMDDPEEAYLQLFGKALSREYEQQSERLKRMRGIARGRKA